MTRFFVSAQDIMRDFPALEGENAAHAKVLRLRPGEQVILCDGEGTECLCSVDNIEVGQYVLRVLDRYASQSEPSAKVSVYIAFPKSDKLEHIIQKATELGAYEIVVFPSARCVSRPDDKSLSKKLERWNKIAASAAEQSGRGCIPSVIALPSFNAAIARASQADMGLLFYENEHSTTLHMALGSNAWNTVSILTGPEGGLDANEVAQAEQVGMKVCTLGKRILRCETAPLCALSAIMYAAGEF